ncbi:hypothetical protein QJQ45_008759 [Haematococcus lacustris]|nr:hypothetical protein QJQ45_008759 [Haematococcus lacustris]
MPERPPLDPIWQTYIIQAHGTGSPPPYQATAGSPLGSLAHQSAPAQRSPAAAAHSPPSSRSPAYQPTTQLSSTELELQGARGTYDHFHAPWNQHNKFLASARASDRAAYRDIPRMPPPPFDKSGRSSMRPASAPRPRTAGSSSPGRPAPRPLGAAPTSLLDNMVTFTGAPCYTVSALIEADLQEGCPVAGPLTPSHKGSPASQAGTPHELGSSRVARVLTYAVPPSGLGYGEGGVRPFHQDYRHYKYFGFAGRGAKTSWAHNPKYAQTYEHHPSPAAQAAWAAVPPQPDPGPELQPLTPVQLALVGQFSGADVPLVTADSADELVAREHQQIAAACEQRWQHLHEREGGSPSPTANRSLATNRPGSARPAPRSPLPTEILAVDTMPSTRKALAAAAAVTSSHSTPMLWLNFCATTSAAPSADWPWLNPSA